MIEYNKNELNLFYDRIDFFSSFHNGKLEFCVTYYSSRDIDRYVYLETTF